MFGLGSFHCWVEVISDLLQTVPVFPESGMKEFRLIMEAFLVRQSPGSVHQVCKNGLFVQRMVMCSRVGF